MRCSERGPIKWLALGRHLIFWAALSPARFTSLVRRLSLIVCGADTCAIRLDRPDNLCCCCLAYDPFGRHSECTAYWRSPF